MQIFKKFLGGMPPGPPTAFFQLQISFAEKKKRLKKMRKL